jgi:nitroreductase
MIDCLPDRETIHTVLSLATRAPSIADSQPWMWRVGSQSLHLYAHPDHGGAEPDAESQEALVSCGASLHHCVLALAALGWRAKVQRLPDAADPGHLAALELYRHPARALDVALAAAIPRQRCDWRPYSSWPVAAADMALIGARAAHAGVTTRRVETLPEVQEVVAQAVRRHATDDDNDDESATRSGRDGSLADTGNGVVLALGTNDDSRLARLRAGEATSLVLLSATALGLASCLVGEPLNTAEAQDGLQANLCGLVGFPQTLLRIGWPPVNADPLPSPPRRQSADVSEWQAHQPLSSVVGQ